MRFLWVRPLVALYIAMSFQCIAQAESKGFLANQVLYVVPLVSGGDAGDGTITSPIQGLQTALDHAGTYATLAAPVTLRLGSGVYPENLIFPPHVRVRGPGGTNPREASIEPQDPSKNIGVALAENVELADVAIRLQGDVVGATLLLIDGVQTLVDKVIFDGAGIAETIGIQALNPDSSGSSVTQCTFRALRYGVRAIDTAINISRNEFELINDDAVVVFLGEANKGATLTPSLGYSAEQSNTGFNRFGNVANQYIFNISDAETKAEVNDWGRYEESNIAQRMTGSVDFVPFLGQGNIQIQPSIAVAVQEQQSGLPIYTASVGITPGAIAETTENEDGTYVIPLVTEGQYVIHARAAGYLSDSESLVIGAGGPAIVSVTIILARDPDALPALMPDEHTSDRNANGVVELSELIRGIQLYNAVRIRCLAGTEDGFALGSGDKTCPPFTGDYAPADWRLNLSELLRIIQFFSVGAYHRCEVAEDGYCPGAS